MDSPPRRALIAASAVLVIGLGLTAAAGARQAPPVKVTACVADREHAPMLSTRDGQCPPGTTATSWDRYGVGTSSARGPRGVRGPRGPAGVPGPQGPAGAAGATGATGATGAVGAAGAPGLSGVQQVSQTTILYSSTGAGGNPSGAARATCPAGKSVISGGYSQIYTGPGDNGGWVSSIKVATSQPFTSGGDEGWEVTVVNNSAFTVAVEVAVTAICATVG